MSHTTMILSALMGLAMVIFIAPNIFAMNRGHILRNIALWLAIFLGLAIFYENFGPDSDHPLFKTPDSMAGMNREEAPQLKLPSLSKDHKADEDKDNKDIDNGDQGFIPPKE
jgi:hypothetical protein